MKRLLFVVPLLLLTACNFSLQQIGQRDAVDSIVIERYDRIEARYLTTGDFSALQEMNTTYPMQTRALIEDLLRLGSVSDIDINRALLDYFRDSTLQAVIYAVEVEFADLSVVTKELRNAFRNLQKEYPRMEVPRFYTQIGAFCQSIVVDNDAVGISLDKYLGKDYAPYTQFFDEQERERMTAEYIVPDAMVFYLLSKHGMFEFARTSQRWRDINTSIMMYVTNQMLEREAFSNDLITRVGQYMQNHPEMTIQHLLEMTDYSEI